MTETVEKSLETLKDDARMAPLNNFTTVHDFCKQFDLKSYRQSMASAVDVRQDLTYVLR